MFDFIVEGLYSLLESGVDVWNFMAGLCTSILAMDIETYSPEAWTVIETISDKVFVPVGCGLIPLFFLFGMFKEAVNIKEMDHYKMIFMLLKLGIAEGVVCCSLDLIVAVFKVVANIITAMIEILGGTINSIDIKNSTFGQYYNTLGVFEALVLWIVAVVIFLVIIVASVLLFYECVSRWLKVLCIIPFGGLVYATIAGSRGMTNIAANYTKFVVGTAVEALVMYVAMVIGSVVVSSEDGLRFVTSICSEEELASGDMGPMGLAMIEIMLGCLLILTIVKSVNSIVHRVVA